MSGKNGKLFFVILAVIVTLGLMSVGVFAQENNESEPAEPEVAFTFTGLGETGDWLMPGEISFSITTKVTDNGAIDKDTPLRYKAEVITFFGSPLANQTIYYGKDYGFNFTTNEDGVAWFGPESGFTLEQLPELLSEDGVNTPFKTNLSAGRYMLELSFVDITEGEVILGDTVVHWFIVYWPVDVEFALTGLEDGTLAGDCSFSITTRADCKYEEAKDLPLEYELYLLKDGQPMNDHEFMIKFSAEDKWHPYTPGVYWFAPPNLNLNALSGDGAITFFQTNFAAGSYELGIKLVDFSRWVIPLGSMSWEFTIKELPVEQKPEEPKPVEPKPAPKKETPRTSGGLPYLFIPGLVMLPAGLLLIRKKRRQGR